mmetsp:Transcript_34597/g.98437  ORF Transcript_34597/g.98437 Transcript_34597/m.98437 type:complete len:237 (-) Transcript_34597:12-722(-)|eukprot:CAMPEP_0176243650 /NCGR_PEP_ID=MMETSP0121_2-20121125/31032_1 /TAXON_ID=160619 /ORGANISM="Kryptoperidinium foliaceum, Strain CCMP 1326" /LENGTH=236 /DNA_ID=CAMNT_0017583247 /DNA_START=67 /DNA_END=777 /DNA_ORIENTATION=-
MFALCRICTCEEFGGDGCIISTRPLDVPPSTPPVDDEDRSLADLEHFLATLTRVAGSGRIGLLLEVFGAAPARILEVDSDETTAAGSYNASAPDELQLRPGDYIVDAAGQAASSASIPKALASSSSAITVLIVRPVLFAVTFSRKHERLGLSLKQNKGGKCILIEAVEFEDAKQAASVDLQQGDRILSVNGVSGDVPGMLCELDSSDDICLEISRAVLPPSGLRDMSKCLSDVVAG